MSVDGEAQPTGFIAAMAEAIVPQFRVVTTGDKRRGVRLERIFWRLLDEIAARRGKKRSGLVQEALESTAASNESVASNLRCFVVASLSAERDRLAERTTPERIIAMMQQAPMPAFAINRQKRLQQVNAEFMQLLRPVATVNPARAAESVHLTLDTPIDELFAIVGTTPSTQCNYTLQVDGQRRRGRAKIVLVPSEAPDTLVGYVLL